jgi:hypothetical protein
MFASDRFSASRIDLYRAEYEGLAYVVVALVSMAMLYFFTVLFIDISFSFNPLGTAKCIESCCSLCIGRCLSAVKGQSSKGGKALVGGGGGSAAGAGAADAALGKSGAAAAGAAAAATAGAGSEPVAMAANPLMAGGSTGSLSRSQKASMLGVSDDPAVALPAEISELTGPPSSDMWPAVKQWMTAIAEQSQQLKMRVAELQKAQMSADADPDSASKQPGGAGSDDTVSALRSFGGPATTRRRASSSAGIKRSTFAPTKAESATGSVGAASDKRPGLLALGAGTRSRKGSVLSAAGSRQRAGSLAVGSDGGSGGGSVGSTNPLRVPSAAAKTDAADTTA